MLLWTADSEDEASFEDDDSSVYNVYQSIAVDEARDIMGSVDSDADAVRSYVDKASRVYSRLF